MDVNMNLIRELAELMKKNDLYVLAMEQNGERLTLKRRVPTTRPPMVPVAAWPFGAPPPPAPGTAPAPLPAAAPQPAAAAAPKAESAGVPIKAPLVGTFYRASSPELDPFVKVGDRVTANTVVCIIEAMKVMNEVKAGVTGVVRRVLAENGAVVEFGQPLFEVEEA